MRRDTKIAIMKKKKTLRTIDRHRNTFVNDDLTPLCTLCSEMLQALKLDEQVKRVWTIDGSFNCIMSDGMECGGEEEARFDRRPLQTWLVRGEIGELWSLLPPLGKSCSTSALQSPHRLFGLSTVCECQMRMAMHLRTVSAILVRVISHRETLHQYSISFVCSLSTLSEHY